MFDFIFRRRYWRPATLIELHIYGADVLFIESRPIVFFRPRVAAALRPGPLASTHSASITFA